MSQTLRFVEEKFVVQSRIVGGTNTGVNEFTMMAGLMDTSDRGVFCGGTIIASNYVVTSAHCLFNRQATSLSILIGDHDYATSMVDHFYDFLLRVNKTRFQHRIRRMQFSIQ